MSPRRTRAKDLRRKTANRQELKTILVFCEGEASEPDYINALKRLPNVHGRTSINIEIDPKQGVPLTLVRRAIERAGDDEIDECWCVFDVEWPKNHPNLDEAIRLADKHGIRLAISNPCFELWLILHFEDQSAFMNTHDAERRSRKLDGRAGKRVDAERYMRLRQAASLRASGLSQRHQRDRTDFPHDNPSSTMCDFLAAIER
ncbi:RloB family protein [Actinokineospora xionganensis]|uniref:RloB domain-containing protein n=1 Tax=Actinokineospora xionganensis TaxID=2684470 RepID=A0ABR7L5W3_9PSEU|nr:RloB family protein [Actinokineospora xionganensis]MBC6448078.1 RloB domain-containing protein [Actinokineospora xionganensis]